MYIYKNKKTGKYYRICNDDIDDIKMADKFVSDLCAVWNYDTLLYEEELKRLRKEKLIKIENESG